MNIQNLISIITILCLIVPKVSYSQVNLSEGLVAHYPFCGNAQDESDNDNNGAVHGAVLVKDRFGLENSAYMFNGVSDYIDCGNDGVLNEDFVGLTISCWVFPLTDGEPQQQIVGKWNNTISQDHFTVILDNNKILFAVADSERSVPGFIDNRTLSYDSWYNIVATWDTSGRHRIYLDGILGLDIDSGQFNRISSSSDISLKIGRQITPQRHNRAFKGSLDDVRIYDRVLNVQEIEQLYNYEFITVKYDTICAGDSVLFNNQYIHEAGYYEMVLSNEFGCDSIVALELMVGESVEMFSYVDLCYGDSLYSEKDTIISSGRYLYEYKSVLGCDSIVVFDVFVADLIQDTVYVDICMGEVYELGDNTHATSGVYIDSLTSVGGCDSIVFLKLNVIDTVIQTYNYLICDGDSLKIGDGFLSNEGTFRMQFPREKLCDSVIIVNLEVQDKIDASIQLLDSLNCIEDMGALKLEFNSISDVNVLWNTGDTSRIISGLSEGEYSVLLSYGACVDSLSLSLRRSDSLGLNFEVEDADCFTNLFGGALSIIDDSLGHEGYVYLLNNDLIVGDLNGINDLDTGLYELSLISPNGCRIDSFFRINDKRASGFVSIQLENQNPATGEVIYLSADVEGVSEPFYIQWEGVGVDCDTCQITNIIVQEGLNYYELSIIDSNGCEYISSIEFDAQNLLYTPNAFTPNGDGRNDLFRVYANGSISRIEYLRVFNRFGDLVYHISDIDPVLENWGWDGRFQGVMQNPGIFAYVITYSDRLGNEYNISGDLTLLR